MMIYDSMEDSSNFFKRNFGSRIHASMHLALIDPPFEHDEDIC